MWTLFEPIHAVTYFTAEARSAYEQAGLRGFWRGYFAGRAAPLGVAGAGAAAAIVSPSAESVSRTSTVSTRSTESTGRVAVLAVTVSVPRVPSARR